MSKSSRVSKKGQSKVPPKKSHAINIEHAKQMMQDFKEMVSKNSYFDSMNIGGTFNRDIFDSILSKPGCSGIRYYFGIDKESDFRELEGSAKNDKLSIIILGVDSKGNVMLNENVDNLARVEKDGAANDIADKSWPTSHAPF